MLQLDYITVAQSCGTTATKFSAIHTLMPKMEYLLLQDRKVASEGSCDGSGRLDEMGAARALKSELPRCESAAVTILSKRVHRRVAATD
jgi:hypothetical protein